MHFEFDAKIDKSIQKAVRSAVRLLRERQDQAFATRSPQNPLRFEDFLSTVNEFMEANKSADLNKLRTPSMRDLFEHTWAQKLRNYATQEQLRSAYESLARRYRAHSVTPPSE